MPSIESKAHKNYSSGDVLTRSEPLVKVIHISFKGKRCDHCSCFEPLLKCSKCKQMYYCSKKCQKSDWVCHKHECDLFSRHGNEVFRPEKAPQELTVIESKPVERLVLRLLLLLKNNESMASKGYQLANEMVLSLNDLDSDENEFRKSRRTQILFDYLCKRFTNFGIEFTEDSLFRLLCIAIKYSLICETLVFDKLYEIRSDDSVNFLHIPYVCCGLYIPLTVYSHSCSPNTIRVMNGSAIELRAVEDIQTDKEITISFGYLVLDKSQRQERLMKHFFLKNCQCIRCEKLTKEEKAIEKAKQAVSQQSDLLPINHSRKSVQLLIHKKQILINCFKKVMKECDPNIIFNYITVLELKLTLHSMYKCVDPKEFGQLDDILNLIRFSYGPNHKLVDFFTQVMFGRLRETLGPPV